MRSPTTRRRTCPRDDRSKRQELHAEQPWLGSAGAAAATYRAGGLRAFYDGFWIVCLRDIPYTMVRSRLASTLLPSLAMPVAADAFDHLQSVQWQRDAPSGLTDDD